MLRLGLLNHLLFYILFVGLFMVFRINKWILFPFIFIIVWSLQTYVRSFRHLCPLYVSKVMSLVKNIGIHTYKIELTLN